MKDAKTGSVTNFSRTQRSRVGCNMESNQYSCCNVCKPFEISKSITKANTVDNFSLAQKQMRRR